MEQSSELQVLMLGLPEGSFFRALPSFFQHFAAFCNAQFVPTPPPFIAACTDGALILFNVSYCPLDVRGACAVVGREAFERGIWSGTPLAEMWAVANKPMALEQARDYFFTKGGQRPPVNPS